MATILNGGGGGTPGADGNTVLNGNSAPATSVGVDGDFYFNTSSQEMYGPKSASAWGSPTDLTGSAGIATIDYKGAYVSTSAYVPGNFVVHSAQTYINTASSTGSTPPASSWDSFPFVISGGDVATDTIFDLKGDLVVGTGSDAAARLSAAPDGKVLVTASAESTGLKWDTPASGGNTTSTNAYASRPAAATNGNLFLPNNSFYVERDTSSTWDSWGPLFKLTPPVDGDFSWINQGSATVATTNGGVYLLTPAAAGTSIKIRAKAVSAPYVITAEIDPHVYGVANVGLGLTFVSSTDQLHTFLFQHSGTSFGMYSAKWTSPTAFSASYGGSPVTMESFPRFLRIADDNANRILSWSNNGQHFHTFHTIGRTDFLTADRVGFFVNADNATYPAAATVLSWVQT